METVGLPGPNIITLSPYLSLKDVFEIGGHYKHETFIFQYTVLMLYRESYMQDFYSVSIRLHRSPYFLPIIPLSSNAAFSLPPNTAQLFYRQAS